MKVQKRRNIFFASIISLILLLNPLAMLPTLQAQAETAAGETLPSDSSVNVAVEQAATESSETTAAEVISSTTAALDTAPILLPKSSSDAPTTTGETNQTETSATTVEQKITTATETAAETSATDSDPALSETASTTANSTQSQKTPNVMNLAPVLLAENDFAIDTNGVLTAYNGTMTEITIPDGVTEIAEYVFYQKNLTAVTFPDSLLKIGAHAFQGNTLTQLDLKNVTELGDYAFADNQNTSLTATGLTTVGDYGFANNALTSYSQSSGSIGQAAFIDNQISIVNIENVLSIGDQAFEGNNLSTVKIGDETILGAHVFGANGRYVLIETNNPNVLNSDAPAGFGQRVNISLITVRYLDQATGESILSDRILGADMTQEVYGINEPATYTPPEIAGYLPVQTPISFIPDSVAYTLVVLYVNMKTPPIIVAKDLLFNPSPEMPDLLSGVKATDLLGKRYYWKNHRRSWCT